MYAWVITKEFEEVCQIYGPLGTSLGPKEIVEHPKKESFRMLDDDGRVYFQGYIVGKETGFEPLHDYGRGSGCTKIQYREGNSWETL